MAKQYDKILGIFFAVIGVLGFFPPLAPNNMLLGIFMVGPLHNVIHLVSGLVLMAAGFGASERTARTVALAFGVVYGLVTLFGFIGRDNVLGILPVNMADNFLHLLIAFSALAVGLARDRRIPV